MIIPAETLKARMEFVHIHSILEDVIGLWKSWLTGDSTQTKYFMPMMVGGTSCARLFQNADVSMEIATTFSGDLLYHIVATPYGNSRQKGAVVITGSSKEFSSQ